ncbi:hypothetical protein G7078_00530 [Sphingomonas sinipercae]|uniref:Uncharacterized protein n=2 Tax=Sphingomonas sinipercae TaxID=2714944 RepID=A0A6G7ZKB8_9SPHN|nr:hypothetical protein [Sphingomonas sinipercae]QIL01421.1 hypothetical protein G7078_00530 [Sphingomonas sinipercae]
MDALSIAMVATATLAGVATLSWAALKGWSGWLELKRVEMGHAGADRIAPHTGGRIELADLKERVRKLEAIAAGIDI